MPQVVHLKRETYCMVSLCVHILFLETLSYTLTRIYYPLLYGNIVSYRRAYRKSPLVLTLAVIRKRKSPAQTSRVFPLSGFRNGSDKRTIDFCIGVNDEPRSCSPNNVTEPLVPRVYQPHMYQNSAALFPWF